MTLQRQPCYHIYRKLEIRICYKSAPYCQPKDISRPEVCLTYLQHANDGCRQGRVHLRAQHNGVTQHKAHDARCSKHQHKAGVTPTVIL